MRRRRFRRSRCSSRPQSGSPGSSPTTPCIVMDRAQEVHTEPPGEAYPLADGAPAPGVEAGGVGGAVVVVEVDVVCCAKTPTAIVTVAPAATLWPASGLCWTTPPPLVGSVTLRETVFEEKPALVNVAIAWASLWPTTEGAPTFLSA